MCTVDRIIAISDVHGENRKLLALLEETQYNSEQDLLVLCGDMIDRGEENLDTLATCEKLQKQGAILIKGNHEQFIQDCISEMLNTYIWREKPSENLYNWFTYNGGAEMYYEIKDLPREKLERILSFTQALPLYFSLGNYIFTHAGANVQSQLKKTWKMKLYG